MASTKPASGLIARLDTDSIPPADWLERVEAILETGGPAVRSVRPR